MHESAVPADTPVLDMAYLDDMRGWVGDDVLMELLKAAPPNLAAMIEAVREAWRNGDVETVREAGHRLKGGASSIACRRLADLGQAIQLLKSLDDATLLPRLDAEERAAMAAIAAYGESAPAG